MIENLDILVTVDDNYIKPLKVMLYSLWKNNTFEKATVWLIHDSIMEEPLADLSVHLGKMNMELVPLQIEDDFFDDAPSMKRYPKEMYFRLLCGEILPEHVKRVLYLDPDILINNSLQDLWEIDLEDKLLAAASHKGITNFVSGINNLRLDLDHNYFNSGVMLIDLDKAREIVKRSDIRQVIQRMGNYLLLPDQDVLNYLYGKYVKEVPEEIWNYDARKFNSYFARSNAKFDIAWVMENTAVLHFCGKPKPWEKYSDTLFTALYLEYARQSELLDQ